MESLLEDVFLESHENGPESFFGGGGAGVGWTRKGGGGPQGIVGRLPERPCALNGSLGGGTGVVPLVSFDVMVVERDLVEEDSFASSSWTSSMDDVESR